MAKTVGDLLIKLGVDGIEGVTQLKSALTGLSKAAGPADAGLIKLGKAIKAFNREGGASRDVIAGKLSALKSLRNQAGLNGAAFRALTKDIVDYQQKLAAADKQIDETTKKVSTLAQVSSQIPGKKAGTFGSQIAAFNEELKELSVTSDKYATVLRNIQERTRSFQRAQARQGVIAAGQTGALGPIDKRTAFEVTTELPQTTAALSLRLTELREDFANIAIGSKDYVNALRQINSLESQIGDPFGTAARKQQIRGRLGQQERFGMFAPRDPVQSAIARRERKRSRRYGGFAGGGMANQPAEATGLFRTIASIGSAEAKAATEMMGRSLSQVTAEIKKQAAASNGSVNSLNAQKAAFAQLRAGLDPTSQDFRQLGIEIDKVDRKLGKLGKKRFSLKGAAQTAGAVASAGIFGGAPGAAGALLGAPFGPGGAVIGGGIGTSVGVAAQQISSFTDYAASIRLAEKALKRLVEVEDNAVQSAHNNAVATDAIEFAIKKFNVEREDATIGMTRLSAAVLGANGTIEQAALAFLGTTAAIKATKGEAEDVRGGITALVQMFSKGKISAEELSGQLGERFPAAVTAFAEANDLNTATLQKQLKDGEVGLDKLIHFLAFATKEYTGGAIEMAESAEESGQRQKRAFDEVRRELGNQLIDVGAKLQEGIADSLIALTPVIVNMAKAVAGAIEVLVKGLVVVIKNFRNLIDAVTVLAGGLVLGKLLTVLSKVTIAAGSKGFLFSIKLLYRFIKFKLVTSVNLLIVQLRTLAVTMAKNPITVIALGFTALGVSMFRASQQHKDFIDDITSGVMSLDDAGKRVDKYKKRLETLQKISSIIQQDPKAESGLGIGLATNRPQYPSGNIGRVAELVRSLQGSDLPALELGTKQALRGSIRAESARITGANLAIQGRQSPETSFDPLANMLKALEEVERLALQGLDGGTAGGKEDISDDMMNARINGMRQVITLADVEAKLANDLLQIRLEDLQANQKIVREAQAHFNAEQSRLQIEQQLQTLQENIAAQVDKAKLATGEITQEQFNQNELERRRVELQRELLPLLIAEKKTDKEIAEIIEAILNGIKEGQDKSKSFVDGLKEVIKEATNLNDTLAEYGVQAVDKFANTFADFVATGKASFRDFANSVLQDLARIFARAAFFQALEAVFPGLGKTAKVTGSAKGNVIAKNKIVPYAMGGIVNKPTLFPMANGAGLMGEAGPEAIMPLRRGANGKLGVEASGGAMGNITVNVDAAGSSVEGDASQANQLGKAIGIAVQQELVKQKRPGGLLAS